MNTVINDKGETVLSIGAPYSPIRLKVERPAFVASIRAWRVKHKASPEELRAYLCGLGYSGLELASMVFVGMEGA